MAISHTALLGLAILTVYFVLAPLARYACRRAFGFDHFAVSFESGKGWSISKVPLEG